MARERPIARGARLFAASGSGLSLRDRVLGPVPWVIAIMVALTALALAGGLSLGNAVGTAEADMAGRLTVQVLEPRQEAQQREVSAALAALGTFPGVASARPVPRQETEALLAPWLGEGARAGDGELASVPVPALIDVDLSVPADAARLGALRKVLARAAPSSRVDAQAGWLGPVFRALRSLRVVALTLIALIAFALAASVLLAVRSALLANRETIELVQLLGASDDQIASVFQRAIGLEAAGGALAGLVLAAGAVLLIGRRFAALGADMVGGGALGTGDWLALALVPVLATVLAMLTARVTVLAALRKML